MKSETQREAPRLMDSFSGALSKRWVIQHSILGQRCLAMAEGHPDVLPAVHLWFSPCSQWHRCLRSALEDGQSCLQPGGVGASATCRPSISFGLSQSGCPVSPTPRANSTGRTLALGFLRLSSPVLEYVSKGGSQECEVK